MDFRSEEINRDGSKSYFSANLIGIVINDMLLRVWGVQRDETAQRVAELELAHSHKQLRLLSGYLQELREREKATLAREIHDTIGQSLTSTKIEVSLLKKKLKSGDKIDEATLEKKLSEIGRSLDETILSVKTVSTELRPAVLDKFGLAAAIEWQCEEFARRLEIHSEYHVPDDDVAISAAISTGLFRILQEALTNVATHARASHVRVDLVVDDSKVSLTIRDNGRGITEDEVRAPTSLGLLGMRERTGFLGGTFSVSGKPGQGTVVKVIVPVAEDSEGDSGANHD